MSKEDYAWSAGYKDAEKGFKKEDYSKTNSVEIQIVYESGYAEGLKVQKLYAMNRYNNDES